ncbi:type II secretion system protein [Lottiidibacillus patelloidae]|uniref:Type II secretion system protein n=1 Tax=Lottiidibacillus patelloidae TaxID=2670334 RepID=A0A263BX52_9BACI|nr:type II secretion system F family protein [Lottiidibacillus patelloidae]OZM58142.1 type II secretion system protein [Lottiidibacillus patelloidae]
MIIIISFTLLSSTLLFYSLFQLVFRSEKRLERRYRHYLSYENKKIDRQRFGETLKVILSKQSKNKKRTVKKANPKLDLMLSRAGVPLKAEEYIIFKLLSTAFLGFLFYLITGKIAFLFLGVVIGFLFPKWWLKSKQKKRMEKFNAELPDMIATIVGSLRAGFSFPQALQTVAEESEGPMEEELKAVLKEMQYGTSVEDALNLLKERMPSDDLDLMIQAIVIQRQVGGNLATVLEKIVQTIRDRIKIKRQLVTLTAQGRISGVVIGLLPVFVGFFIYLIEPEYILLLFQHPVGIMMLAGGVFSGSIGFFIIRKMTVIEV